MMWENSFFFCVPDFHSCYWSDCPFSMVCSFFLCHKSIIHWRVDFFWALNSVPFLCITLFFWSSSVQFQIGKGVCQGCILSSCLSNFCAEYIMRNGWLDEAQAGIKIAGRNINHLRYADDNTLMAESKEKLKSLLMKVKEENEKVDWKLNIQKTKIRPSGPITSWQIDGETVKTVTDFILGGSKITADGDCSHEIKRHLLLGRKAMINLDRILKSRDITLSTKSV